VKSGSQEDRISKLAYTYTCSGNCHICKPKCTWKYHFDLNTSEQDSKDLVPLQQEEEEKEKKKNIFVLFSMKRQKELVIGYVFP
jgi:hypothetical protein